MPDSKWSLVKWYSRLQQLHGVARDPRSPMFLDKDKARPLLYRVARQCFIDLQTAVGVAEGEHAGLHGLRVAGYNRKRLPVHANAGSSEQLAAASESLSGELRATKYGTEGSGAYCARGRPFVSQRAPPRAPALATHGLNVRCKKTNRAPQRTYRDSCLLYTSDAADE